MEKQKITVFLNKKAYHLTLDVEQVGKDTVYRVAEDQEKEKLSDFIPDNLEFDVDGQVKMDDRIRTVEGQDIAREIWKAIREQLGERGEASGS